MDLSQLYVHRIRCKGEDLYKHFASVRTLCIDIITIFVVHRSFRNKYDSTNKISFLQPLEALYLGTSGKVFSEEKSLENVYGRTTTEPATL